MSYVIVEDGVTVEKGIEDLEDACVKAAAFAREVVRDIGIVSHKRSFAPWDTVSDAETVVVRVNDEATDKTVRVVTAERVYTESVSVAEPRRGAS